MAENFRLLEIEAASSPFFMDNGGLDEEETDKSQPFCPGFV